MFCRTRTEVDQLTETLNGRGYRAEALHGGMSQEQRDRVMGRLRTGTADLLIATDVAARGLDIDQLTHVVNYDVPSAPEAYVHRIGRVGRAGREGVAITLAEPREQRLLGNIERVTGAADHRRAGADRRRPARPPDGAHDRRRCAARSTARRPRPLPRRRRRAVADEFDVRDVARGRGEAGPRGQRVRATRSRSRRSCPATSGRRASAGDRPGPRPAPRGQPGGRSRAAPKTRLFIGLGRKRPHPARRPRRRDRQRDGPQRQATSARSTSPRTFSTVDVPAAAADAVIAAIKQTTISGKRAKIRRDRHHPERPVWPEAPVPTAAAKSTEYRGSAPSGASMAA